MVANIAMFVIYLLSLFTFVDAYNNDYRPRFSVYWNIPSEPCFEKGIAPSLEKYGFLANRNQSFYGKNVVTLYSNKFGAYPFYDENGVEHFGGIPQKANFTEHLLKAEIDIKLAIPDEDFEGVAVIDFEDWRPLFRMNWGVKNIYKQKSIEYVYERRKEISDHKSAVTIAAEEFDRSALHFMVATVQLGRKLRPKGKWGFYGFPYCNPDAGRIGSSCSPKFQNFNNLLLEMYRNTDVFYPSIYFTGESSVNYNYRHASAVLTEAQRIAQMFQQPKPIYAFTKFEYNTYSINDTFYTRADLCASIKQPFDFGINGLIFWSTSTRMLQRCWKLQNIVETVVGPYVWAVTTFAEYCSTKQCSGNGKCMLTTEADRCNDHNLVTNYYECQCDKNWYDPHCGSYKYDFPVDQPKIPVKKIEAFPPTEYF